MAPPPAPDAKAPPPANPAAGGVLLVGAGGHGRCVAEALILSAKALAGYVDPEPSAWARLPRRSEEELEAWCKAAGIVAIGIGGVSPDDLKARLALVERYRTLGAKLPVVRHPSAVVSPTALVEAGAILLAGAIVQPAARIGRGALINTRAIIEHDVQIGPGAHIAPGAMVLGGSKIGEAAMIGAGAIILPGSDIAPGKLVKAGSRHPR